MLTYVLFALGIGLGVASATEDWFDNPNTVYSQSIFSTPYAISVDCVPDGSQCLAGIYAEGLTNQIAIYSSTDDFVTSNLLTTISIDYSAERSLMNHWNDTPIALPLAIKYNPDDGLYYVMTSEKVYSFDLTTLTEIYDHSDIEIIGGYDSKFLGLLNGNEPKVVVLFGTSSNKNLASIWLYNGSTVRTYGSATVTSGSVFDGYGFVIENSGGSFKRYARWGTNGGYIIDNTGSLPTRLVYTFDIDSNFLRYLNETGTVYKTTTTDFSTFSGTTSEYDFDITASNITNYGNQKTDESNLYFFINDTASNIAYFYQQKFYNTYVDGSYYDVKADYYRTNLNISAQIECFNTTYSDSLSNLLTIEHPCDNYTLTVFSSSGYRPVSFTRNIEIQDGCDYNLIYARFINEYDYIITVYDDVTQLPLVNANVQFGSQSGTTDSNGEVSFTILPLTNITMTKTDYDVQCREEYVASASALKTYSLTITKSGYTTYFEPTISPAEFVGDEIAYDDDIQINLRPVGGNVIVKLRDVNGREIENPELSSITEIITNGTVYVVNSETDEIYVGNRIGGVPVNFFVTSNLSSFNVTVNLSYMFYNYSDIVEIEQDETTTVYFRLNTSTTEMPCESNFDCVDDFCQGNNFYQLSGCIQGQCSYQNPEVCTGGCDEDIGCYARKLTTTCESRYDCYSNCTGNYVSYTGLCASDGYCVQIRDTCEVPCVNETTGVIYNYGCSPSTGRCCDADSCYEGGFSRYLFQLSYEYVAGIIPSRETELVLDYNFYCDIDNQGERTCLNGAEIPIYVGSAQTYVNSNPDNWDFSIGNQNYDFYDISIKCGANCNATWEYCQYGCNFETGFCNHAPINEINITERYDIDIYQPIAIIEDSINRTQFAEAGLGFLLLFVTPIFLVTLIGIVIGIMSAYFTKEPVVGVSSMVAIFIVFSLLSLYPIWIPIVIIIIAGLLFSKIMTGFWNRG